MFKRARVPRADTAEVLAAVQASRIRQKSTALSPGDPHPTLTWMDSRGEYKHQVLTPILDAAAGSDWIELDGSQGDPYRLAKLTAAGETELARLHELGQAPSPGSSSGLAGAAIEAASRLEDLEEYGLAAQLRQAVKADSPSDLAREGA